MLTLQPMTPEDYSTYKTWLVEDYAREIAQNFHVPMEEARASSAADIEGTLSQGLSTPEHFLYNLVTGAPENEPRLGYLWIHVDPSHKRCFIFDIYLHEQFRHQGWGRKVLELLEATLKQQEIQRINLNVFANNTSAREFYDRMGFECTSLQMQKWLTR